jgi:hypothetical protein
LFAIALTAAKSIVTTTAPALMLVASTFTHNYVKVVKSWELGAIRGARVAAVRQGPRSRNSVTTKVNSGLIEFAKAYSVVLADNLELSFARSEAEEGISATVRVTGVKTAIAKIGWVAVAVEHLEFAESIATFLEVIKELSWLGWDQWHCSHFLFHPL